MSLLRPLVALTAITVAAVAAQDTIVFPEARSDATHCNVIPFGSFTKYPFPKNQKYQVLIPWSALSRLSRPVIEAIGFKACDDGVQRLATIQVRLGQTQATGLSEVFAANLGAAPAIVLDARDYYWHRKKGAWTRVGLQRSFAVRQGWSLVVDVEVTGSVFLAPDFEQSDTEVGGFEATGSLGRVYALGWKQAPPARGKLGSSGLRIELCSRTSDLGTFGIGCKGSGKQRPTLLLSGSARPSGVVSVSLASGASNSPTLLVLGFDNRSPFPIGIGYADCRMYHSVDLALAAATNANGKLTVPIRLPATAGVNHLRFYGQFFQVELAANTIGLRGSNYGRVLVR